MNTHKIAMVLGGGGFVGRYLIAELAKKNFQCFIPTRNAYLKGYLKTQAPPGAIEFIDFNPKDFSKIKEAIKSCDIVINLIGILYENRKQKFFNIHSDLPELIAKYCSESEVKKFINVSALGASETSKSLYQQSKFSGEQKAFKNFKNTVVVRPSICEGQEAMLSNLYAKLSFLPVIPVVKFHYKLQPVLVTDVAKAIMKIIETKKNEGKIYEIGGPKIISFGDMVKSILNIIGKKRLVVDMPMPLAKIQATLFGLMPKPLLTKDQCEILNETDNIVSNNHLTLKDLNIKPDNVEQAMSKWLWRFRSGGEFAKV